MTLQLKRAQVPVEETWRIEDIFASQAEWEAELAALMADKKSVGQFQGRLGEGAPVLLACLTAAEDFGSRVVRVTSWAQLQLATDGADPALQAAVGRAAPLWSRVAAQSAWIRSELLQLPEGTVERYLAQEPRLEPFRTDLTNVLGDRRYALAPEAEKALADMSEVLGLPYQLFQRATTADMTFDLATDSQGNQVPVTIGGFLMNLEPSPDTALRRSGWQSLIKGMKPYRNTMASSMSANIRRNVLMARMRGFGSAQQMALESAFGGHERQGISVEHFEGWVETLQAELAPHMRRYARLRKRALGLDKLLLCDVTAAVEPAEYRLSYEQGKDWILDSVAVLGNEYQAVIRQAFDERWIDRADNAGRAGMAFCSPVKGKHCYVFSTWTSKLRGLFILAHELGHAGHFEMTMRNQPLVRYSSFFVEAPSTLNELLLAEHIRRQSSDPALHRQVIISVLNTYHHNYVTHLLEAELLRRLYRMAEQDQPLTAQTIGDQTAAMLGQFWGDEVELDEGARLNWMRQPHYYMGLYPYTYSVGLTGSTMIARMIAEEGAPVARRWVEVLKAGGSKRPWELFEMAGVNITHSDTLKQAVTYVARLIDDLERSLA